MSLRLTLMAWRHRLPYHFAHAPLCDRHRRSTLQLGGVHVCRSCLLLHAGWVVTLALLTATRVGQPAWPWAILGLGLVAGTLSHPLLYHRLKRRARDGVRLGAGICLGVALAATASPAWPAGLTFLGLGTGLYFLYARRRAAFRRRACAGCPELGTAGVCSGFRIHAHHIRRYEARASDLLQRHPPATLTLRGRRIPDARLTR